MWVDAQFSPHIARWMSGLLGVEAIALRDLGLRDATDKEIFERARLAGAVILTKDADFVELARRRGAPPSILWMTVGNTSNARVRSLLEASWPRVSENLASGEALIELTERL